MEVGIDNLAEDVHSSKYTSIPSNHKSTDVQAVWDSLSSYIERQLTSGRGVSISGLGTFALSMQKLEMGGSNKVLLSQRPVFLASEKFCQSHQLKCRKPIIGNTTTIAPLNMTVLAMETPYSRDVVERSLKETMMMLERSIYSGKNVKFSFKGVGKLEIRNSRLKMKFFKEFLNSFDQSGKLVDAMRNRPGTMDSVMSERAPSTRLSRANTVMLMADESADRERLPTLAEEVPPELSIQQCKKELEHCRNEDEGFLVDHIEASGTPEAVANDNDLENEVCVATAERLKREIRDTRSREEHQDDDENPRQLSSAGNHGVGQCGLVAFDDLALGQGRASAVIASTTPTSALRMSHRQSPKMCQSASAANASGRLKNSSRATASPGPSRPASCAHANAGQELCYVCYQRERANVPVDLRPLRSQKERDEDAYWLEHNRLVALQQAQEESENKERQRFEAEKVSAFNAGVIEAKRENRAHHRQEDVCPSYIFPERPLTGLSTQESQTSSKNSHYRSYLENQIEKKKSAERSQKDEELLLGKIEQNQLSQILAAQKDSNRLYRKKQLIEYRTALDEQVRRRPDPIPPRLPDSLEPIFGRFDGAGETERREKLRENASHQLDSVSDARRHVLLDKIAQQKAEQHAIRDAKDDLIQDRADRYHRLYEARKTLERQWLLEAAAKKSREQASRMRCSTPGALIHEGCDRYKRCGQCKRKPANSGQTNLWKESHYLTGTRYIL